MVQHSFELSSDITMALNNRPSQLPVSVQQERLELADKFEALLANDKPWYGHHLMTRDEKTSHRTNSHPS